MIAATIRKYLLFGGLAALVLAWAPLAHAGAQPHMFGSFGLVEGQTARLNAVVGNPDFIGNPDLRPVQVELMFLDGQGNVLAHSTELVMPGHAVFLDFQLPRLHGRGRAHGARTQIRGIVVYYPPDPGITVITPPEPAGGPSTLEIFNTRSGQTIVLMNPGAIRGLVEPTD